MSNTKTYTAIDFERYHAGTMGAHEMHALEKAALNDPFLADALDGYVYTPTPVADVALLEQQLFNKKQNQQKVSLLNIRWLQAAAACLLFGGLGWLFYSLNNTDKTPDISQNKPAISTNTTIVDSNKKGLYNIDTVVSNATTNNNITPITTPTTTYTTEQKAPEKLAADAAVEKPAVATAPIKMEEETIAFKDRNAAAAQYDDDRKLANATQSAKKAAAQQYEIKGVVINEQGAPLANARVKALSNNNNVTTTTDNNGNYKLQSNNAVTDVVVNANGYNNVTTNIGSTQLNKVVLQNNNSQVLQNKVTEADISQNVETIEEQNTKNKKDEIAPTTIDLFNAYVAATQKPILNELGIIQHGNVQVNFKVDKKGHPYKISIKNSNCKLCNNQAIALVKAGPLWPAKQPQTVLIVF